MYGTSSRKELYLRRNVPDKGDYDRLRRMLQVAGVIGADRDYGSRLIRVLPVPDFAAEDIACLVDPTCHVSHLSAMQRWGLTDRSPRALSLTRPERKTAQDRLRAYREEVLEDGEANPFTLRIVKHPTRVRRRPVKVHESKAAGASVRVAGTATRLSTIGQTFLDTVQSPQSCGGMAHVLDVWEEHAATYLEEIVAAVDAAPSRLVKGRAGYILEEHLRLRHDAVEAWKALGQRGSSRKLDPTREFASKFSETWMLSLNV